MTEKKRNRDIVIEGNPQPETPTEMRLKQRNAYTPLGQRVPIDPSDNIDHMDIKYHDYQIPTVLEGCEVTQESLDRDKPMLMDYEVLPAFSEDACQCVTAFPAEEDLCDYCKMLTVALKNRDAHKETYKNSSELLSKSLRAICLMRDFCPSEMPAKEGWEWFDVGSEIAKAIPHDEWAREFRERVKIDQDNRAIADSLRNYLFSANAYAKCDVPMFNVVPGFLDKMGFSQHEQDRLVKVNAIRIEESILTDKDQAKLFDEYQIPDKDEYAKSCANKLANMTDSERSEYLNGSFEPVQAGLDSDKLIQPQDFPEDFKMENGQYWHNCECGLTFTGHKRRGNLCKICTQKDAKVE